MTEPNCLGHLSLNIFFRFYPCGCIYSSRCFMASTTQYAVPRLKVAQPTFVVCTTFQLVGFIVSFIGQTGIK